MTFARSNGPSSEVVVDEAPADEEVVAAELPDAAVGLLAPPEPPPPPQAATDAVARASRMFRMLKLFPPLAQKVVDGELNN